MAGLAGTAGSGVSATEAASEADAAIALLKKAVALGYRARRRRPHRAGPRPAPQPSRLPPADDGPGHPGRAVRVAEAGTVKQVVLLCS